MGRVLCVPHEHLVILFGGDMNIIEKLEKAQDTNFAISTGRKKWTMNVPVGKVVEKRV